MVDFRIRGRVTTAEPGRDTALRDIVQIGTSGDFVAYAGGAEDVGAALLRLDLRADALARITDIEILSSGSAAAANQRLAVSGPDQETVFIASDTHGRLSGVAVDAASDQIGAMRAITGLDVGGRGLTGFAGDLPHVYVAARDGSLTHYRVDTTGNATRKGDVVQFAGAVELDTVTVSGARLLLGAGTGTGGLASWRIDETTRNLTAADAIGTEQGLGIMTPVAFETATLLGKTYAILLSAGTAGGALSVMQIGADGTLTATDHALDTTHTRFGRGQDLSVVSAGGRVQVVAGGGDDGLSLFELAPGGRLVHLGALTDGAASLNNISALAAARIGTTLQILAASETDRGLTQIEVDQPGMTAARRADPVGGTLRGTSGADFLAGGVGHDRLEGGGGDDILIAGIGRDTLVGGAGRDIFVLEQDNAADVIADFEPGRDRIDTSRFRFLYAPEALSVEPTATGAILGWHLQEITVLRAGGGTLTRDDLFRGGFDWAQHTMLPGETLIAAAQGGDWVVPPDDDGAGDAGNPGATVAPAPGSDRIVGTDRDDTLAGGGGDDTLIGGPGADRLESSFGQDVASGGGGDDWIHGSHGHDTLSGGDGADWVHGGPGYDSLTGGSGDDTVYGGDGDDTLSGGDGDDTLGGGNGQDRATGGAGDDFLNGFHGHDSLEGGAGNDLLQGGFGFDSLSGGDGADTLSGGNGRDTLRGGSGDDIFFAHSGDDVLSGGDGHDLAYLGDGNDIFFAHGLGRDTVFGLGGDDTLFGGWAPDLLMGGDDRDRLMGGQGFDTLAGGTGDDWLHGEQDNDLVAGDGGNDSLFGGMGADTLRGGAGHDRVFAGSGDDLVSGGDGDDLAYLGLGNDVFYAHGNGRDTVLGLQGDDTLSGGDGDDSLAGHEDDDALFGGTGHDTLSGGAGSDRLFGDAGGDRIAGDAGDDRLLGGSGADTLDGGHGDDALFGGEGRDRLTGGTGDDWLTGGAEADDFVFNTGAGRDTVADFEDGIDRLVVDAAGADFDDLTITRDSRGTVISLGQSTLILEDVGPGVLGADDFLFG